MLVGIGIIGTFTSSITSYLSRDNEMTHDKKVLQILQAIEDMEEFNEKDAELIQLSLKRKKKDFNEEILEKEYN